MIESHRNAEGGANGPSALQSEIAACHRAASTINTSFSASEIEGSIRAAKADATLEQLRGKKVAIIDDDLQVLRSAIPILVTATADNASFIYLNPARDIGLHQVIEALEQSGAEWVLLDGQLSQDFSGVDVAARVRVSGASMRCIGFSTIPELFEGAAVEVAIAKYAGHLLASIRAVAHFIGT